MSPQVADLVYYPDSRPGIRRRKQGRGFSYLAPDGTRIDQAAERKRIEALAVPPAYEDVWICPKPDGHLQATGRDTRTRKQYRYHPDWTAYRARQKYDHLADFGAALPRIRRRVQADLRGEAGDRAFALAAVLALIDRASLRIGNRDYVRENDTFGATTLKSRHVSLSDGEVRLSYPGKGGKPVRKRLRDATLGRTLARLDDLPGAELITWQDDDGTPRGIDSGEVNALIAELVGTEGVTAKTFRTWNGSVAALEAALAAGPEEVTIKAMADAAAERLHNTPTIARSSYIHPEVIALSDGTPGDFDALDRATDGPAGLRRAEVQLLHLLGAG